MSDADYKKISTDIRKILSTTEFPPNAEIYNNIIELEDIWKEILLSTKHGIKVYEEFIKYIMDERKNILDARPFMRIRQKSFLKQVNPYLRSRNPKPLTKIRINYTFITWANDKYLGPHKTQLLDVEKRIAKLRSDFITRNFPLILNRLKIFVNTYPGMDNIPDILSSACQSAVNGLDKFEPTYNPDTGETGYSSVLLSTIIGRIRACCLAAYSSQSNIHLFPKDKKRLIEINKLKKDGVSDFDISKKLDMSEGELSRLYNSFFPSFMDDDFHQFKDTKEISDEILANREENAKLKDAIGSLSCLEQKILFLKGYQF